MTHAALADTTLRVGGGPDGTSPIYCLAGTFFDVCSYVLHRLPSIWGHDADVFNPDRWNTFKPKTWEYQLVGGGPRACAGQFKALMEASYVIVRMLQEFRGIESRDDKDWIGKVQLTVETANGCHMPLHRHKRTFINILEKMSIDLDLRHHLMGASNTGSVGFVASINLGTEVRQ